MIAYQFDTDSGDRESLSILYNDVLVVNAPQIQQAQVNAVIEAYIGADSDGQYDEAFNRPGLVTTLAAAGFAAEWLTPNLYINEE